MGIEAVVDGNLLVAPVTKLVTTREGQKPVVEFRVMAASYRQEPGDDGELRYVQDDKKTIPVQISIWGERLGEQAMLLLKKGASVRCTGSLFSSAYIDSQGDANPGLHMSADSLTLGLARVEEIVFREKAAPAAKPD